MNHLYLINNEEKKKSYKFVFMALVEYVGLNTFQAEQCCLIAKEVGLAHIMKGDVLDLIKVKNTLEEKGLTVELTNKKK